MRNIKIGFKTPVNYTEFRPDTSDTKDLTFGDRPWDSKNCLFAIIYFAMRSLSNYLNEKKLK